MSQTVIKQDHETAASSPAAPVENPESPQDAAPRRHPAARVAGWVTRAAPTFVVLVALAGIGFWGHYHSWKAPTFSALLGQQEPESEAWCAEHNVPENECIECLPSLTPGEEDFGWCQVHGVHQCPYCHPEVAQLATTPVTNPQRLERVRVALAVRKRKENTSGCTLYRRRVQFASVEAVRKAGIDVELVQTRPVTESISSNGEITYDQTRVAHLSSRVPGTVWRVEKRVGDRVRVGETLALVDSAVIGQAKSDILQSLAEQKYQQATYDRVKPLHDKGVVTTERLLQVESDLEKAGIRVRRAQQSLANMGLDASIDALRKLDEHERAERLRFLGISPELRADLGPNIVPNNLVPIFASMEGVVIQRHVVEGEVVGTDRTLFGLADTSKMWLTFNVPLEEASDIKIGQKVEFEPDGLDRPVGGMVSWISTNVDRETRTVDVRADLENTDGQLRNETFGFGRIILREEPAAIVVPSEAIHWDGTCYVVFVRDRDYFKSESQAKIFHTRTVRPGVASNGQTEVLAGLLPGEVVVTKGSSVLRSQVLRNNLGAGCTCGH